MAAEEVNQNRQTCRGKSGKKECVKKSKQDMIPYREREVMMR